MLSIAWCHVNENQLIGGDATGELRLWDMRRSGTVHTFDQHDADDPDDDGNSGGGSDADDGRCALLSELQLDDTGADGVGPAFSLLPDAEPTACVETEKHATVDFMAHAIRTALHHAMVILLLFEIASHACCGGCLNCCATASTPRHVSA